ncbi:MAG: o-succinylbenzoate synthase [Cyclobacteriaceae bacterium]|nr:o-succinylbenzoate synthase [Cyclobacteriaceae bacterium]
MALQASYTKRTFHFSFNARTSRGAMKQRDSWFLKLWDTSSPDQFGLGEAAPVSGLSLEKPSEVHHQLDELVARVNAGAAMPSSSDLEAMQATFGSWGLSPSVYLALETAWLDLRNGGRRVIFDNEFHKGKPLDINGLVWMGGLDFMLQQVSIKIDEGFTCIKLKIGGLNFEKEMDILNFIRRKYFRDQITIRLDANGAFKSDQAMYKLMDLSRFDIHSIEQPIKPGSPFLAELCQKSPIPIALDEELIGVSSRQAKVDLLETIKPQFLVLKPTLHGGFCGCAEWIRLAEERKVGWWLTSSMESSVGLNALAQFAAQYPLELPQGLGTGMIFRDNIPSPLEVKKGQLRWNSQENWDLSEDN